jgi:hypothetical protein
MTTAGPKATPRYAALDQTTGKLLGRVYRDPANPRWWIADHPDNTRIDSIREATLDGALAAVHNQSAGA